MTIQPLYLGNPVSEEQLSALFAKWADPKDDLPAESLHALYRNAQNSDVFISSMARDALHSLSNGTLEIIDTVTTWDDHPDEWEPGILDALDERYPETAEQ